MTKFPPHHRPPEMYRDQLRDLVSPEMYYLRLEPWTVDQYGMPTRKSHRGPEKRALDEEHSHISRNVVVQGYEHFHELPIILRVDGSLIIGENAHPIIMPEILLVQEALRITGKVARPPAMIFGAETVETKAYTIRNNRDCFIEFHQEIPEVFKNDSMGKPLSFLIDCPILKALNLSEARIEDWHRNVATVDDNGRAEQRYQETVGSYITPMTGRTSYSRRDIYEFRRAYILLRDRYRISPLPFSRGEAEQVAKNVVFSKEDEILRRRIEKAYVVQERALKAMGYR